MKITINQIKASSNYSTDWDVIFKDCISVDAHELPGMIGIRNAISCIGVLSPFMYAKFIADVSDSSLHIAEREGDSSVRRCIQGVREGLSVGSLAILRRAVATSLSPSSDSSVVYAAASACSAASAAVDAMIKMASSDAVLKSVEFSIDAKVADAYNKMADAYESAKTAQDFSIAAAKHGHAKAAKKAAWRDIESLYFLHFA